MLDRDVGLARPQPEKQRVCGRVISGASRFGPMPKPLGIHVDCRRDQGPANGRNRRSPATDRRIGYRRLVPQSRPLASANRAVQSHGHSTKRRATAYSGLA
jgi:hypothetical protein